LLHGGGGRDVAGRGCCQVEELADRVCKGVASHLLVLLLALRDLLGELGKRPRHGVGLLDHMRLVVHVSRVPDLALALLLRLKGLMRVLLDRARLLLLLLLLRGRNHEVVTQDADGIVVSVVDLDLVAPVVGGFCARVDRGE